MYAIRGTVPGSFTPWLHSLDVVRNFYPEHLVPSHTRPLSGQKEIQTELTNYRDAIQFVHDQTIRFMNRGLHPVDVAKAIKLPPSLRDNPFLQSFYGTPEWSSRAVFDAYIGWFSGNPEELFPLSPTERGKRMIGSFGVEQILQEAELAMTEEDPQWALELSSHVFLSDPSNREAKHIRSRALLHMASQQTSAAGRNYLLTYLLEDHDVHPRRYPSAKVVLGMSLDTVFKHMGFLLKAEEVEAVTMAVVIKFTDLEKAFTLHVRNCILEVEEIESNKSDMKIWMESVLLKQILAGEKTAQQLREDRQIDCNRPDRTLTEFFAYFELGDEYDKKTGWRGS